LGGRPEAPLDLILANILSGVLEPLLPSLRDALAPRGSLIVSGILAEEASVFRRAAGSAGLLIEREDVEEEWWSARFSRPRPAG
jgi:ribosomal protein L11 methyltransferase